MSRTASAAWQVRLQAVLIGLGTLVAALSPLLAPKPDGATMSLGGAFAMGGALLFVALALMIVYPTHPTPMVWYLGMSLQLGAAAGVAWFTGGADSPAFFLMPMVAGLAGLKHSPWTGVALGGLGAVLEVLLYLAARDVPAFGMAGVLVRAASLPLIGSLGFLVDPSKTRVVDETRVAEQARRLEEAYATSRQQAQEREQREHELYDKQRKLSGLMQVSRQLSTIHQPDELLAMIVRSARDEMNSAVALVGLTQGSELRIMHAHGLSQLTLDGLRWRVGSGVLGRMCVSGESCRMADADGEGWQEGLPGIRERLRTLLAVPLQSPQDRLPFGVLAVGNLLVGERYLPEQEDYLKILATDAAICIKNMRLYEEVERSYNEIILALAQAIEAKDPYTHGHVARVRTHAVKLARALNLPPDEVELISKAAILHDVGKISIPDGILMKPGSLSAEEFEIMKSHAENALHILKDIRSLPPRIIDIVLHHHERYDGKGYPHGLKGEEIPLGAQIIGVADTYDAMTSDRPYRKGFTPDEALRRMESASGTQFNPRLLKAFFGLFDYRPGTPRGDERPTRLSIEKEATG